MDLIGTHFGGFNNWKGLDQQWWLTLTVYAFACESTKEEP